MAGSPEARSQALEKYKNFNKLTFVGSLGVAGVSAFVAPPLVVPALGFAAIDGAQIIAINKINKKNSVQKQELRHANDNEKIIFRSSDLKHSA